MPRVLIIEDEAALASALGAVARRLGCETSLKASASLALEELQRTHPDLIILDIGLPDMNGLEVLQRIRAKDRSLPVLVITAHGNLNNAVEAKKRGASGYLVKPIDLTVLEDTLRVLVRVPTSKETSAPTAAPGDSPLLIGSAPVMQPAFAAIADATASDAPVLILGPTGIGKSLAAQVIHLHSRRHAGPFVTLSCASLPESLLEAELFGHEKGAFTGALTTRSGHVERASGGTLFLDEIAEVSPAVQVKLLRLVEEKTFTRVGGREDLRVDLRIMAATNQDLEQAVAEKRFREDLYYRLRVLEVKLPPLRERASDLPALCSYLLARIAPGRRLSISDEALALLRRHDWPGNVRELRNALERAAAVCGGPMILPIHLPAELKTGSHTPKKVENALDAALAPWLEERLAAGVNYDTLHEELEGRLLAALLPRYENKPTLLARALDMNRATLRKKLRSLSDADPAESED